jgi:hypothetical protein
VIILLDGISYIEGYKTFSMIAWSLRAVVLCPIAVTAIASST